MLCISSPAVKVEGKLTQNSLVVNLHHCCNCSLCFVGIWSVLLEGRPRGLSIQGGMGISFGGVAVVA